MTKSTVNRRTILAGLPAAAAIMAPAAVSADPSLTYEQLAAQDFEPVREFGSFSLEQLQGIEENFQAISVAGRMSLVMLSEPKAKIIENVRGMDAEKGDASIEIVAFLTDAHETAQQLADLIQAAQVRLAVAMANVYPGVQS